MCDETVTAIKGGVAVLISPQGKRYPFQDATDAIKASHPDVFQKDYFSEEKVEG